MYTIMTDSCCDLNPKIAGSYKDFEIIPLSYTMSGETHANTLYDTETVKPYYNRLRAGEMSTTSQISPAAWQEAFLAHAKKGAFIQQAEFLQQHQCMIVGDHQLIAHLIV